jgi:hypothetical protein
VGSTSHLHTTILHMTRALVSTINLYNTQQERKQKVNNEELEDSQKIWKSKEKDDGGFGAQRIATQDAGVTKMGLSPSPRGASYSGPLLSNVAKTIKAIQDAKGPEKPFLCGKGSCQKMHPGKKIRKEGEVTVQRRGCK